MTNRAAPPSFATLVLLTAFSTVSLNMFLPSLGEMAAEFRVDYAVMNLAVAGYLGVTAALQLILGPLSDRFGRRPVMLAGVAIFAGASVGCLLAEDIWTFLVFRMAQGAMIAGAALSPAIVRDTAPARAAASRIGYIAMTMAIAPMLGPMAGGALDALFGWRASFVVFAASGTLLFLLAWFDLGETNQTPSQTFRAQFRVYPELLSAPLFWSYALAMALSTGSFYVFLSGAPVMAAVALDLSPAELGVCLGSITGGFMLGGFVSGRLAARTPLATMMIAGRVVAALGLTGGLVAAALGEVSVLSIFGATIFVGFGNGVTIPSASAGAMSVREGLAGSASGLAGALTVGIGGLLTSIAGAVLPEGPAAAPMLLALMLALTLAALAAALAARRGESGRSVAD